MLFLFKHCISYSFIFLFVLHSQFSIFWVDPVIIGVNIQSLIPYLSKAEESTNIDEGSIDFPGLKWSNVKFYDHDLSDLDKID